MSEESCCGLPASCFSFSNINIFSQSHAKTANSFSCKFLLFYLEDEHVTLKLMGGNLFGVCNFYKRVCVFLSYPLRGSLGWFLCCLLSAASVFRLMGFGWVTGNGAKELIPYFYLKSICSCISFPFLCASILLLFSNSSKSHNWTEGPKTLAGREADGRCNAKLLAAHLPGPVI